MVLPEVLHQHVPGVPDGRGGTVRHDLQVGAVPTYAAPEAEEQEPLSDRGGEGQHGGGAGRQQHGEHAPGGNEERLQQQRVVA